MAIPTARPVDEHGIAADRQPGPQPEPQPEAEDGGVFLDFFEPGRVVSAVVLSEIMGPPVSRRSGPRFFRYSRRNRLYSGGRREDGAERGTDSQ